jgi:hypothetical protein
MIATEMSALPPTTDCQVIARGPRIRIHHGGWLGTGTSWPVGWANPYFFLMLGSVTR